MSKPEHAWFTDTDPVTGEPRLRAVPQARPGDDRAAEMADECVAALAEARGEFVADIIAAALRQYAAECVAAEREAAARHIEHCAAAAEGKALVNAAGLRHIAAAIRARGGNDGLR